MSLELTPLSGSVKLDAVNEILEAIDEPRVSALDTGGTSEAADAEEILDREIERILSDGWAANTVSAKTYAPDGSDEIVLTNILRVERPDDGLATTVGIRNGKLYDRRTGSTTFATSVTLRVVELLSLDALPENLRWAIIASSRLKFWRTKKLGQPSEHLEQELNAALAAARREDEELRRAGASNDYDLAVVEILETVRGGTRIAALSVTSMESEARAMLERSNVRIQQEGWPANTAYDKKFTPDGSSNIVLTNVLSIRDSRPRQNRLLTIRDGKLYNATDEVNTFTEDIYLDTITKVAYDQLPAMLKQLINKDAAYRFQVKYQADRSAVAVAKMELDEARIDADQEALNHQPRKPISAIGEYRFTGSRNTNWTRPDFD